MKFCSIYLGLLQFSSHRSCVLAGHIPALWLMSPLGIESGENVLPSHREEVTEQRSEIGGRMECGETVLMTWLKSHDLSVPEATWGLIIFLFGLKIFF